MTQPRFQVGCPDDLQPDDPWFSDEPEAVLVAENLHSRSQGRAFGWGHAYAVWDENHDMLHLFAYGRHFKPE